MARKRRNGSKWITVKRRYQIYLRDGFGCFYCPNHRDDYGVKLSLDHINSDLIEKAGKKIRNNKSENLVTCCRSCNSKKGTKELPEKILQSALEQASKPLPDGDTALTYKNRKQLSLFGGLK
tara:strand:- start:1455 stop:1820 length:366 start_codon:yes stop_codon:yes gene_type:complete